MTRRSISSEGPLRLARSFAALLVPLAVAIACDRAGDDLPLPPDEIQACLDADGLRRLGDPEGALSRVEAVLVEYPCSIAAHRVVQDCLRDLGRDDEARQRYRQLQRQSPRDPTTLYLAGRAELPDGDAARPWFEECADLDPEFDWCAVALARLEVLDGDLFGALQIHRESIRDGAAQPELHLSAGFLYLDMRLLRDAERSFEAVLAERPWDTMAMGGLGQVQGLLGREKQACEILERALAIDPSRTDLLGALAYVRFHAGDPEGAWDALILQQEIDGSADPLLAWTLERTLQRQMPHVVVLGPYYLTSGRGVQAP